MVNRVCNMPLATCCYFGYLLLPLMAGTGQQYKYGVGKMVFLHLHLLHKQGWLSYTCDGHGLLPHCLHTLHVPRLGNQAYAIHIVHQTCQLSSHMYQAYIVCTPSMSSNLIVPTNQTIQWQEIPWDLLFRGFASSISSSSY